jgi:hypothetical protein
VHLTGAQRRDVDRAAVGLAFPVAVPADEDAGAAHRLLLGADRDVE